MELPLPNATSKAHDDPAQSCTMWKLFGYLPQCQGVSGRPSVQEGLRTAALTLAFKLSHKLLLWHSELYQQHTQAFNYKKIKTF